MPALTGSFGVPDSVEHKARSDDRPWLYVLSVLRSGAYIPIIAGLGPEEIMKSYAEWQQLNRYNGPTSVVQVLFAEPKHE